MKSKKKYSYIQIGIASPEEIRSWSYGEVKKHETINYRTLKPERDGLFCEVIFGPTKDYQCACGKSKKMSKSDKKCEKCGVDITESKVRRERMGHIELVAPVVHTWFMKNSPSKIALLLDMKSKTIEDIVYFASYIVVDPGTVEDFEKGRILTEQEYAKYQMSHGRRSFTALTGAEAIKKLLQELDLGAMVEELREELKTATKQRRDKLIKRLEVVEAFHKSGNKPEWMVMDVIPVLPPDLRPMVQLDGGRFATTDLNDLYRRIITRNNRLRKQIEQRAPSLICKNEKRMLQEAVDALIDNGKKAKKVVEKNHPLKSLSDLLRGKQGRFRQNLLGKRVDFSGRSVIVVGPDLKMYQCGIPREMALILFKPFIINAIMNRPSDSADGSGKITLKEARTMIEQGHPIAMTEMEKIIVEHPVLLNRAPTLHRLGIQAFEPKLVEGKAIRLHPLSCTAFNADFDGDQMAVHVPLSEEAKAEARLLMLGAQNILDPKSGKPIVTPSQDMVLGNYYLSIEEPGEENEGKAYKNSNEAIMAYERREITLHTRIVIPVKSFKYKLFTDEQKDKYLVTTAGKLIFNEILPDSFPYINEASKENIENITPSKFFLSMGTDIKAEIAKMKPVDPFVKKNLSQIIAQIFKRYKTTETSAVLDAMKDLGFKYSTIAGITVSAFDIIKAKDKDEKIAEGQAKVDKINKQYQRGLITEEERYSNVIQVWNNTKDDVEAELKEISSGDHKNPIFMMMNSGARGNAGNFTQLAGMRGCMAKPNGQPVEIPIKSNFIEGLNVSEFFLSTHGARKGSADTALRTADSGYMTRRLVDVAQDIIVKEADCGAISGIEVSDFIDEKSGTIVEPLEDRLIGRFTATKVINPETKELIIDRNEMINENIAKKIVNAGIKKVEIRSALTCKSQYGVCQKCYGRNLATGNLVETGEAVGVMAAQSIGEPGTQLTMRTFHSGGVAHGGDADITQGLPRVEELFEARNPKAKATIAEISGKVVSIEASNGKHKIVVENDVESREHTTLYNAKVRVEIGQEVVAGEQLTEGSVSPKELLAVTDPITAESYILKEIQKVYKSQGVDISDKHIEVIVRRMISKMKIVDGGDTDLVEGLSVSLHDFNEANKPVILNGGVPATGRPIMLGITKSSLETDSWLSAASFQETTRVLTEAAIKGKTDELRGLKENVIIGKLIPAGTGAKQYSNIEMMLEKEFMSDEPSEFLEEQFIDDEEIKEEVAAMESQNKSSVENELAEQLS